MQTSEERNDPGPDPRRGEETLVEVPPGTLDRLRALPPARRWAGIIGACVGSGGIVLMAFWALAGWASSSLPSPVDVLGVVGLRTPAAVVVAGLLVAAAAFSDL